MNEYDEIPFQATNYEYRVTLGTVGDENSLGWACRVYCRTWEDVSRLVDAWRDSRDHPAVEVDAQYRPEKDHLNAE